VLVKDLQQSRDRGLANVEQLVSEWAGKIALPAETIRTYLTRNIHYALTEECIESLRCFRAYAAELGVLPASQLRFL